MALKRLKWLKYLFVGRSEGETEQRYWNEKRKKHLANEHSAGIVNGLEVTATAPPSLRVQVAGGRAVDSNGDDPEVESVQELDLTSLVPPSGQVTVFIALSYSEAEVDPYFVDEIGEYQHKYVQDGAHLEVLTAAPSAPTIELARVLLGAGATEITNATDPENPGPNELDLTHRDYTGKEVLTLDELADVSPDEAAAFNNMNSPSGSNPIGTLADIEAGVSPVRSEVQAARGSKASLDARLDVALGEDGGLKGHAATHKGDGSDAIAAATPIVAGLMSVADKGKLDGVEPGAVAAGEVGDAHAAVITGNPHDLDPADVGATPASHVGAGGGVHAAATGSVAGFMSGADKGALDGHIGAGGSAHALAAAAGAAGFMSGADKSKLDGLGDGGGGGTWKILDPGDGNLETQMAGMQPGDKFWLKPGNYILGATLNISPAGVRLAGTKEAVVVPAANTEIQVSGEGCVLFGFTFSNSSTSVSNRCIYLVGAHGVIEEVWFDGHAMDPGRRTAVLLEADYCTVRRCRFFVRKTTPGCNEPLVRLWAYATVERCYFETTSAGDWDTTAVLVGAGSAGVMVECRVLYNQFYIRIRSVRYLTVIASDGPCGFFVGRIVGNHVNVNASHNYVTGITLSGKSVVDGNLVVGCEKYGIYSNGIYDGMQITNNKVLSAAEVGIRLYKTTAGLISCNVTIAGNHVRYCLAGILVSYQAVGPANSISVLGNSLQDISGEAIRVESTTPYIVEHVNISDNNVNGFVTGIVVGNCRKGTIAHNQLRGGTGIGIDLSGGDGNYDIKLIGCYVETAGAYCYHIGHQRNTLMGCSGRGASTAIFYVTGSHNSVIGCETAYIDTGADILRVDGLDQNVADNDFSYGVLSGAHSLSLTSACYRTFVHGNRLAECLDLGSTTWAYDNVVEGVFKLAGF